MDINRLSKLKELALRGVGGEKEAAERLLEKLMIKYNIDSIDDIQDEISLYTFKFSNKYERKILAQVIYKILDKIETDVYKVFRNNRAIKNIIGIYCTKSQSIEIDFLYDFYCKLFKTEIDDLLEAFIYKHDIYGSLPEGESPRELDEKTRSKLSGLAQVLSSEEPLKQITEKSTN